MAGDVIALDTETVDPGAPLLTPAIAGGRRIRPRSAVADARQRVADDLAALPDDCRRLRAPARYPVSTSPGLARLDQQIRDRLAAASPPHHQGD